MKYVFSKNDTTDLYFLSGHLNQDPVENYFGKNRSKGGRLDNPSAKQFLGNAATLRQQGSMSLDPVRENCSRKRLKYEGDVINDSPLPRRSAKKSRKT